jgi:hypothetical protein
VVLNIEIGTVGTGLKPVPTVPAGDVNIVVEN